jgi:hypothetical protein
MEDEGHKKWREDKQAKIDNLEYEKRLALERLREEKELRAVKLRARYWGD